MFRKEQIISFSEIKLKVSGMRLTRIYEIIPQNNTAQISLYRTDCEGGKDNCIPEKKKTVPLDKMLDIINRCDILKWDGFNGKNPPGVLDGTMFTFMATVNETKKIYASGSNNFPKHYRDFVDAVNEILRRT